MCTSLLYIIQPELQSIIVIQKKRRRKKHYIALERLIKNHLNIYNLEGLKFGRTNSSDRVQAVQTISMSTSQTLLKLFRTTQRQLDQTQTLLIKQFRCLFRLTQFKLV